MIIGAIIAVRSCIRRFKSVLRSLGSTPRYRADIMEATLYAAQQAQGETCSWAKTEYDWGEGYGTECGERVQALIDIEGMRFCPYCGRKLSPVR